MIEDALRCSLVSTENIKLQGEQLIDYVQTDKTIVLVAGQIKKDENWIYISSEGPWQRLLVESYHVMEGCVYEVTWGTMYSESFWLVTKKPPELTFIMCSQDVRALHLKSIEQACGNLLARIHRDGGHYINKHGWKKSCSDAENLWVEMRTQIDNLEYANKQLHELINDGAACCDCELDGLGIVVKECELHVQNKWLHEKADHLDGIREYVGEQYITTAFDKLKAENHRLRKLAEPNNIAQNQCIDLTYENQRLREMVVAVVDIWDFAQNGDPEKVRKWIREARAALNPTEEPT